MGQYAAIGMKRDASLVVSCGRVVVLSCLMAIVAGCGGGSGPGKPKTVAVSGKVTYKGAPVPGGTITFAPQGGAGKRAGSGPIQTDGSFVISSYDPRDGVEPGDYKVVIDPPPPNPDTKAADTKVVIPEKYKSVTSTPLTEKIDSAKSGLEIKLED